MSVDELAARLDYKSLKRAMQGEIALPESKRRHIQDLVLLYRRYGPSFGTPSLATSVPMRRVPVRAAEDPPKGPPREVPIVSRAQAGLMGEWEELPEEWQHTIVSDCPDPKAFALEVEGDSMAPYYQPGDVVVVMPSFRPYDESVVVAKLTNGEVMLKILQMPQASAEELHLVSYNKDLYRPKIIRPDDLQFIFPVYSSMRKVWNLERWRATNEARKGE